MEVHSHRRGEADAIISTCICCRKSHPSYSAKISQLDLAEVLSSALAPAVQADWFLARQKTLSHASESGGLKKSVRQSLRVHSERNGPVVLAKDFDTPKGV